MLLHDLQHSFWVTEDILTLQPRPFLFFWQSTIEYTFLLIFITCIFIEKKLELDSSQSPAFGKSILLPMGIIRTPTSLKTSSSASPPTTQRSSSPPQKIETDGIPSRKPMRWLTNTSTFIITSISSKKLERHRLRDASHTKLNISYRFLYCLYKLE